MLDLDWMVAFIKNGLCLPDIEVQFLHCHITRLNGVKNNTCEINNRMSEQNLKVCIKNLGNTPYRIRNNPHMTLIYYIF